MKEAEFTKRELELIRMFIEEGKSTKEAAWDLHITQKTGETHRGNLMRKLRRKLGYTRIQPVSAVDLTLFAITNGLVDRALIEKKYRRP